MTLETFRGVLEATWRQLDEALDGLDDAASVEPGVVETWSVKDLLGHVAAWEQVALRLLGQFRAGEQLRGVSGPQVNAHNAAESRRRAEQSLTEARRELAATREQLRAELGALDEAGWRSVVGSDGERFGEWFGGTLGGPLGPGTHAAEHAHHILVWRVRRAARP